MKRFVVFGLGLAALLGCGELEEAKQKAREEAAKDSVKTDEVPKEESSEQVALREEVAYLAELPNVEWHEVDGNNVYIGLKEFTEEDKLLVGLAALRGNRKINRGVHAWGIVGGKRGWRPGDAPKAAIERTARYGKMEK